MAFKNNGEFKFEVDKSMDEVVEEGGNKYLGLKKVSFNGRPSKLDLRTWYTNSDGTEKMGKGATISDEGANNLAIILLKHKFGKTEEVINTIKTREDFLSSLKNCLTDKDLENVGIDMNSIDPSQFYDPMNLDLDDDEGEE